MLISWSFSTANPDLSNNLKEQELPAYLPSKMERVLRIVVVLWHLERRVKILVDINSGSGYLRHQSKIQ